MSMAAVSTKGIHLARLEPDNFMRWWKGTKNFMAIAGCSGFMSKKKHASFPLTVSTVTTDKVELATLELHARFVGFMTHAMVHEDVCGIVDATVSSDWPQGEAHLIYSGIYDRFFPFDRVAGAELIKQLSAIQKIGKHDDPTLIFSKLTQVLDWFPGHKKTEQDLLEVIISKLPANYMGVLYEASKTHGDKLTRPLLYKELNDYYRLIKLSGLTDKGNKNTAKGDSDDEDTEVALSAFSGKCYNCQKMGHRAADCRAAKENGNGGGSSNHNNGSGRNGAGTASFFVSCGCRSARPSSITTRCPPAR